MKLTLFRYFGFDARKLTRQADDLLQAGERDAAFVI